jgi:hypothetical protein
MPRPDPVTSATLFFRSMFSRSMRTPRIRGREHAGKARNRKSV